jgi:hypothetical protein
MTPPSSDDGDTPGLCRDAGSDDVHAVSSLLRFKDFKHLKFMNAKDPTTFLVWWLQFKSEVCNIQELTDFWSPTSNCTPKHHASVLSILTQVIHDYQAKTKLIRFVSSDDPHRDRRAVDGLLATFLRSPRLRFAIMNRAIYLPMQRAEDLTDFKNRLNLVRMELE